MYSRDGRYFGRRSGLCGRLKVESAGSPAIIDPPKFSSGSGSGSCSCSCSCSYTYSVYNLKATLLSLVVKYRILCRFPLRKTSSYIPIDLSASLQNYRPQNWVGMRKTSWHQPTVASCSPLADENRAVSRRVVGERKSKEVAVGLDLVAALEYINVSICGRSYQALLSCPHADTRPMANVAGKGPNVRDALLC